MILAIRTDTAVLQLWLYNNDSVVGEHAVELGRSMARDILTHIEALLADGHVGWSQLTGLIVFTGPGSFTGLRIGATVANTIAYAEGVPVIGRNGDDWLQTGLARLREGENDKVVLPHYGKPANTTTPRK